MVPAISTTPRSSSGTWKLRRTEGHAVPNIPSGSPRAMKAYIARASTDLRRCAVARSTRLRAGLLFEPRGSVHFLGEGAVSAPLSGRACTCACTSPPWSSPSLTASVAPRLDRPADIAERNPSQAGRTSHAGQPADLFAGAPGSVRRRRGDRRPDRSRSTRRAPASAGPESSRPRRWRGTLLPRESILATSSWPV